MAMDKNTGLEISTLAEERADLLPHEAYDETACVMYRGRYTTFYEGISNIKPGNSKRTKHENVDFRSWCRIVDLLEDRKRCLVTADFVPALLDATEFYYDADNDWDETVDQALRESVLENIWGTEVKYILLNEFYRYLEGTNRGRSPGTTIKERFIDLFSLFLVEDATLELGGLRKRLENSEEI